MFRKTKKENNLLPVDIETITKKLANELQVEVEGLFPNEADGQERWLATGRVVNNMFQNHYKVSIRKAGLKVELGTDAKFETRDDSLTITVRKKQREQAVGAIIHAVRVQGLGSFVESCLEQYIEKGFLSDKQIECLNNSSRTRDMYPDYHSDYEGDPHNDAYDCDEPF